MKTLYHFLQNRLLPKSTDEDSRRREFIVNIILAVFILLLGTASLLNLYDSFIDDAKVYAQDALSLWLVIAIFFVFVGFYVLSRMGHFKIASYACIVSVYLLATYLTYRWGVDLPTGILFYVLTIVIAGILIDTSFAFVITTLCAFTILLFGYFQYGQLMIVDHAWKQEAWSIADSIMIVLIYTVIVTVSWLSNREIERSLRRARRSEAELREERDLLEVRVQERTEELKRAELERMSQAYRFVEFGRIAGGIFHDLVNPLTALSLNIESIAASHNTHEAQLGGDLAEDVARARTATTHMRGLMESMRRHIAQEGHSEIFSLSETIRDVVQTLKTYAQDHAVVLSVEVEEGVTTMGDRVAFTQVLTNLLSNAIESFPEVMESREHSERNVYISLTKEGEQIQVTVRDTGPGISEEDQAHIFDPFFSTKGYSHGLGIGLSVTKRIVEKEFSGTLTLSSDVGKGTTFTIYFPQREPPLSSLSH